MAPQFAPNLNIKSLDYFTTIQVKDDDNEVSMTFPVREAIHHGGVTLTKDQFKLKLKNVEGVTEKLFGAPWKGNFIKDLGLVK
jgi:hypothetical protein